MDSMKAFISYSTEDREHTAAVKSVMGGLGVDSFLAHENIHVSEEWQQRIRSELRSCDIFVPLLSSHFKKSDWCGQETGIAITREAEVLIFPVSVDGTTPYAFLSHIQALDIKKLAPQAALDAIGERWPARVPGLLQPAVEALEKVRDFRRAEAVIGPLERYFQYFTREQAGRFIELAIGNAQIWDATLCAQKYLPKFLVVHDCCV